MRDALALEHRSPARDERLPPGPALAFILTSSLALWGLIAFGVRTFFG